MTQVVTSLKSQVSGLGLYQDRGSESGEHASDFVDFAVQSLVTLVADVPEISGEQELVVALGARAHGDLQESRVVPPGRTTRPLGDIRGNRYCRSSKLTDESIPLFSGEAGRELVDGDCIGMGTSPDLESIEVPHGGHIAAGRNRLEDGSVRVHAASNPDLATCDLRLATCDSQLATRDSRLTTHDRRAERAA